jgi:hypothetical protein
VIQLRGKLSSDKAFHFKSASNNQRLGSHECQSMKVCSESLTFVFLRPKSRCCLRCPDSQQVSMRSDSCQLFSSSLDC